MVEFAVIPELRNLRQEVYNFKDSLSYIMRLYFEKKRKWNERRGKDRREGITRQLLKAIMSTIILKLSG